MIFIPRGSLYGGEYMKWGSKEEVQNAIGHILERHGFKEMSVVDLRGRSWKDNLGFAVGLRDRVWEMDLEEWKIKELEFVKTGEVISNLESGLVEGSIDASQVEGELFVEGADLQRAVQAGELNAYYISLDNPEGPKNEWRLIYINIHYDRNNSIVRLKMDTTDTSLNRLVRAHENYDSSIMLNLITVRTSFINWLNRNPLEVKW